MNPADRHLKGCAVILMLAAACALAQDAANQPPVIKHQPVTAAVRGQPITVLANVTDDAKAVRSVTLFYSLSKDAAPFRVPMKSSGTSLYFGTIPAGVLSGVDRVSYYVEALDNLDAMQETAWHTIVIRDPTAQEKAATQGAGAAPAGAPPKDEAGANLLGMGIIAGGAAAVLGGAVLMSNSDDDDDDDSGGGGSGGDVQAGTYSGTSTECETLSGGSPSCESHTISIVIDDNGAVSSADLREGDTLAGTLRGSDFTLVAELSASGTDGAGEIVYSGTVVDQRILGSITGSRETAEGTVSFSGTFSATLN